MRKLLNNLWFKFQVWYGSRCECGGTFHDVPLWDKMQCDNCKKTVKA